MADETDSVPFRALVGHEIVEANDGNATATLDITEELSMQSGERTAHGGVICTLADAAAAAAVNSVGDPPSPTMDLRVDFLAPARGKLTASATLDEATRDVAFVSVRVLDDSEQLVAKASGTFKR